uniref:Ovule protein n=1 Tax=Steinernema glaseri TaxID=37863 RepID=A0A1I7YQU8_9BILA
MFALYPRISKLKGTTINTSTNLFTKALGLGTRGSEARRINFDRTLSYRTYIVYWIGCSSVLWTKGETSLT